MKNIKNLFALSLIALASVFAVSAQEKTQNEGVVAYSFIRQDVKFERPTFKFNENTDSHGVSAGYTRYTKGEKGKVGVFGFTGELAANFDSNEASVLTALAGVTAKARNNSFIQPYVRAMVGGARQHVNRRNITDTTDVSFAYDLGAGIDFAFKKDSRYALRTSADYINTSFYGQRQNAFRLGLGVTF